MFISWRGVSGEPGQNRRAERYRQYQSVKARRMRAECFLTLRDLAEVDEMAGG